MEDQAVALSRMKEGEVEVSWRPELEAPSPLLVSVVVSVVRNGKKLEIQEWRNRGMEAEIAGGC